MYSVFDPRQRLRFMLILVMLLVQSLVEVLGLGLILPLLYEAQDTGRVLTNPYLNFVYELFHFKSGEQFTVFLALTLVFAFVFKGFFSVWLINIQTKFSHTVSSALIERQTRIGFGMDYLTFKK